MTASVQWWFAVTGALLLGFMLVLAYETYMVGKRDVETPGEEPAGEEPVEEEPTGQSEDEARGSE